MTTPALETTLKAVIDLTAPLLRLGKSSWLTASARLNDDLLMDSLDRQSLACELEEHFGIAIGDGEVADWFTLADVVKTVDARRSATGGVA